MGLRVPVSHLLARGILLLNRPSAPPDLRHPRTEPVSFRATIDKLWDQNAYGKVPGEQMVWIKGQPVNGSVPALWGMGKSSSGFLQQRLGGPAAQRGLNATPGTPCNLPLYPPLRGLSSAKRSSEGFAYKEQGQAGRPFPQSQGGRTMLNFLLTAQIQ